MYAGSINQIAVIVAVISGIIVLLFGSRIPSHIYLIIRAPEGEGLSRDTLMERCSFQAGRILIETVKFPLRD
jgi:hypothetical protein